MMYLADIEPRSAETVHIYISNLKKKWNQFNKKNENKKLIPIECYDTS